MPAPECPNCHRTLRILERPIAFISQLGPRGYRDLDPRPVAKHEIVGYQCLFCQAAFDPDLNRIDDVGEFDEDTLEMSYLELLNEIKSLRTEIRRALDTRHAPAPLASIRR